jgi:hypothetical protein
VLSALRGAGIDLHALKINGAGEPSHPLYLRASLKPAAFYLGS